MASFTSKAMVKASSIKASTEDKLRSLVLDRNNNSSHSRLSIDNFWLADGRYGIRVCLMDENNIRAVDQATAILSVEFDAKLVEFPEYPEGHPDYLENEARKLASSEEDEDIS